MLKSKQFSRRLLPALTAGAGLLVGTGVLGMPPATAQGSGSLTVLIAGGGAQWPGLLPATDSQDAADYQYLNSIYGQLFEQGPDGTLIPDLATGYSFSPNKKTVTIDLRHGVKFTDGTPFNAAAVAAGIKDDLAPSNGCICSFDWNTVSAVTTSGPYKVLLHMSTPFPQIVQAFVGEAPNWIPSPTALAKEGAANFAQHPVGAGPFSVVSNAASSQLILKANPNYWEKGFPKLNSLKFIATSSDQAAFSGLQAGTGQMVLGLTTVSLIHEAQRSDNVVTIPGTGVTAITMNTQVPPFNNIKAREAIYYATDEAAILKNLDFSYGTLSQSPTGPGGRFYTAKVPGYRTPNLAKAQALVKQLGGLQVNLLYPSSPTAQTLVTALEQQWQAAGMKVTLDGQAFAAVVGDWLHHNWSITSGEVGGPDPIIGVESLGNSLGCKGAFSGVCDPALDKLITTLRESTVSSVRAKAFAQAAQLISNKAYAVYGVVTPWNSIQDKSVTGVKLVSGEDGPIVRWQNIGVRG